MEIDLGQAKQTFIAESAELLQEMEEALLALESSPGDQGLINSLFRSAHTLKGSSGIVGIETVEKFTHVVENLLSTVREGGLAITPEIIELLLECRDHTSGLIELASANAQTPEQTVKKEEGLVERLSSFLCPAAPNGAEKDEKSEAEPDSVDREALSRSDAWHISLRFSPDLLRDGMDPMSFIHYLSKLGEIVSISTLYQSLPPLTEMDPEAFYLGFEIDFRSEFDKKTIEDVFEFAREGSLIHILPPNSRVDSYVELIHNLPEDLTLLGEILVKGGALTRTELDEALALQAGSGSQDDADKPRIGEIMVDKGMTYPELVDAALEKQKKALSLKSKEASTIRIDAGKLDSLVTLVGELVIASANIGQRSQRVKDAGLMEAASHMSRLVEEIRDTAMKVRMVPIGETFSRFNRVIRDIAKETGKEIELKISGGETELDKTVVEKIADPLMHIVRNAADHGIERPEERTASAKPAKGLIRLNAFHDAGSIVIEVIDDGRGLNRKRIYDKALALGLIAPNHSPTDTELLHFIFEPGFSTAAQITKLSGRGVGMDVVKKNIEALRGSVDLESGEGGGTAIRIRLPLTLAIIDGFLVGVGDSQYVIPLEMVVECVELTQADKAAAKQRDYVNLRGELLPYIRLRNYFAETGKAGKYENIVVVQYAGQKIGLVTDELFGEVQTVIKSLGRAYKDIKGISGATIMGNGRVALILDVPRLIQSAEAETSVAI